MLTVPILALLFLLIVPLHAQLSWNDYGNIENGTVYMFQVALQSMTTPT
jgi:hypothetical protein